MNGYHCSAVFDFIMIKYGHTQPKNTVSLRNCVHITFKKPDIVHWKTNFFIVLKACYDHLYDPVNVSVNEAELDRPLSYPQTAIYWAQVYTLNQSS